MKASRTPDEYRPTTWRRRLLIVALAVVTGVAVVTTLLDPPGGVQRKRATVPAEAAAGPAVCAPGQSGACVGGKAEVIVPSPPASR